MRSRLLVVVAAFTLAVLALVSSAPAKEPRRKDREPIKENAYYEFRAHISDRNTLEHTFTLGWDTGSQIVVVTRDTRIYRKGRAADLEDAKAGDAARGFGQVKNGKLIALAVAFGEEGVELPPNVKIPDVITLPPAPGQ